MGENQYKENKGREQIWLGHEARNKEEGGKDRESLKQLSQLKKRARQYIG
jgi:hypothetical protein